MAREDLMIKAWSSAEKTFYTQGDSTYSGGTLTGNGHLDLLQNGTNYLEARIADNVVFDKNCIFFVQIIGAEDWGGAVGSECEIISARAASHVVSTPRIFLVRNSATGYFIRLKDLNGVTKITGATELPWSATPNVVIRIEIDKAGQTTRLENGTVGGTLVDEGVTASFWNNPTNWQYQADNVNSAKKVLFAETYYYNCDARSERMAVDLDGGGGGIDTTVGHLSQWPTITGGGTKNSVVDDLNSGGAIDESNYVSTISTTDPAQQLFNTLTVTIANPIAILVGQRTRVNIVNKTVTEGVAISDNSVDLRYDFTAANSTFSWKRPMFSTDPAGGALSQSDIDSLQIGPYADRGADACDIDCAAVWYEVMGCGTDPPAAATGDRRRLLAGVT